MMATVYACTKRPAGPLRPEDFPEGVQTARQEDPTLLRIVEIVSEIEGYRVLSSEEGRRRLSFFLSQRAGEKISAAEVQALLGAGRETTRRLLRSLEKRGVVQGVAGEKAQRVTRYLCCKVEDLAESSK